MVEQYDFDELDPDTHAYLIGVRDGTIPSGGRKVEKAHLGSVFGLLAGVVVLIATLLATMPPLDDPWRSAMLQTAGLLLGGWLVFLPVRLRFMSNSSYLGHFIYADPFYLYEASGSRVTAVDLLGLSGVGCEDRYDGDSYQDTTITLVLPGGHYQFKVADQERAQELALFLKGLTEERELPPQVEALPRPQRTGTPSPAWPVYVLLLILTLSSLYFLKEFNTVWRDDAIYEMVKTERPPVLRAYLIDPRNTRHREEVEQHLGLFYSVAILNVRNTAADAELRDGFIGLLKSVQTAVQPVVSMRVEEQVERPAGEAEAGDPARLRQAQIERQLVEGLTRVVGEDLIAFVQAPADVPPLLAISYKIEPVADQVDRHRVKWTVSIRPRPEEEPRSKTWTSKQDWQRAALEQAVQAETEQTLHALAGVMPREVTMEMNSEPILTGPAVRGDHNQERLADPPQTVRLRVP